MSWFVRGLLRVGRIVVPEHLRRDWYREWRGELEAAEGGAEGRSGPSVSALAFALGAIPDALALRLEGLPSSGAVVDFRQATRSLLRSPTWVATTVLVLTLGLASSTLLFLAVHGIVLRTPAGIDDARRVVQIGRTEVDGAGGTAFSWNTIGVLEEAAPELSSVGAWSGHLFGVGEGATREGVFGHFVTGDYFRTLGTVPLQGRLIDAADARIPEQGRVVVLSHPYWERAFAADPSVVGTTVAIDGDRYEVVGVAPEDFVGLHNVGPRPELFVPASMNPGYGGSLPFDSWRWSWLHAFGRLDSGASEASASAALTSLASRLRPLHESNEGMEIGILGGVGLSVWDRPAAQRFSLLSGLLATLLFVLATAASANLSLARAGARRAEIGVRMSLGAGEERVSRQMIFEAFICALLAALASLALIPLVDDVVTGLIPMPVTDPLSLNASVVGFVLFAAVGAGLLLGAGPALYVRRLSTASTIRIAPRSGPRHRLRDALVTTQIAVAVGMVAGGALLGRSMVNVVQATPGFDPRGVLATRVTAPFEGETRREDAAAFYGQLLDVVARDPRVEVAAVATQLPIAGGQNFGSFAPTTDPDRGVEGEIVGVAGPYFEVVGMPILRGRAFLGPEAETERVAIVSTSTAELFWPGQDPIGMELSADPNFRVVGVVSDAQLRSLTDAPNPTVYYPLRFMLQPSMQVLTRGGTTSTQEHTEMVEAAVARAGSGASIGASVDIYRAMVDSMEETTTAGAIVLGFSLLALAVAGAGLYGLVAYTGAQRTREFGVRVALGADPAGIRRLVVRDAARLTVVGVVLGVGVALLFGRGLRSVLYEVGADDPISLALAILVSGAVTFVATWIPARRAGHVDPAGALSDRHAR